MPTFSAPSPGTDQIDLHLFARARSPDAEPRVLLPHDFGERPNLILFLRPDLGPRGYGVRAKQVHRHAGLTRDAPRWHALGGHGRRSSALGARTGFVTSACNINGNNRRCTLLSSPTTSFVVYQQISSAFSLKVGLGGVMTKRSPISPIIFRNRKKSLGTVLRNTHTASVPALQRVAVR